MKLAVVSQMSGVLTLICLPSPLRSWLCVLTLNFQKMTSFQWMQKKEHDVFCRHAEARVQVRQLPSSNSSPLPAHTSVVSTSICLLMKNVFSLSSVYREHQLINAHSVQVKVHFDVFKGLTVLARALSVSVRMWHTTQKKEMVEFPPALTTSTSPPGPVTPLWYGHVLSFVQKSANTLARLLVDILP